MGASAAVYATRNAYIHKIISSDAMTRRRPLVYATKIISYGVAILQCFF